MYSVYTPLIDMLLIRQQDIDDYLVQLDDSEDEWLFEYSDDDDSDDDNDDNDDDCDDPSQRGAGNTRSVPLVDPFDLQQIGERRATRFGVTQTTYNVVFHDNFLEHAQRSDDPESTLSSGLGTMIQRIGGIQGECLFIFSNVFCIEHIFSMEIVRAIVF